MALAHRPVYGSRDGAIRPVRVLCREAVAAFLPSSVAAAQTAVAYAVGPCGGVTPQQVSAEPSIPLPQRSFGTSGSGVCDEYTIAGRDRTMRGCASGRTHGSMHPSSTSRCGCRTKSGSDSDASQWSRLQQAHLLSNDRAGTFGTMPCGKLTGIRNTASPSSTARAAVTLTEWSASPSLAGECGANRPYGRRASDIRDCQLDIPKRAARGRPTAAARQRLTQLQRNQFGVLFPIRQLWARAGVTCLGDVLVGVMWSAAIRSSVILVQVSQRHPLGWLVTRKPVLVEVVAK